MHLRMGVGNGISTASTEHEIHTSGNDEKTGTDGLLEHPAERNLGKAAFGFRIAATDIAVNAWEPDLLEIARTAIRRRVLRNPEIGPEKGPAFVDGDRVTADFDIGVVARKRQLQWVFIPADRTYGVPNADKPRLADPRRKCALEVGGQIEVALFFSTAMTAPTVDRMDPHEQSDGVRHERIVATRNKPIHAQQRSNRSRGIG